MTHTASVAALADQHLVVDKAIADSRAVNTSAGTDASSSGSGGGGGGGGGESGSGDPAFAAVDPAAPILTAAAAAGEDEDKVSPSAWRSRRHGASDGGLTVSIREVQGQDREQEVARMAAGDMAGGAAAELAREMLRYSRRKE